MKFEAIKRNLGGKVFGFSLPEVLIAVGILGILMAVLIPTLKGAKPDQNEILHKKATFIVNRVINEIATDEFLYPNSGEYRGLSNTNAVTVNGQIHQGKTKFCTLFASRLNRASGSNVECADGKKSLTSIEGIDWYLPISDFKDVDFASIVVDVNGDKKPNSFGKDQYEYKIRSGDKVPVRVIANLEPTAPPGARPGMPPPTNSNPEDPRTGQNWWCISCSVSGPGAVFGLGCNKPNGHYQLVAIPSLGYKGSWFTKNVTVKDRDFTDCAVSFVPGLPIPTPDGGTTVDPPKPPDPEKPKTYCINVVMTGEKGKCTFAGAGCNKAPGKYVVTAKGETDYKPSWTKQEPVIVDKDITLPLECNKEEVPDPCYSITTTGDIKNCPVTMPTPNCKTDKTKYMNGTHKLTITPKPGFIFNNLTTASNHNVLIAGKDETVKIVCPTAVTKKKLEVTLGGGQNKWTGMTGDFQYKLNGADLGYGVFDVSGRNTYITDYELEKLEVGDIVSAAVKRIKYTSASVGNGSCAVASGSGKVVKNGENYYATIWYDCSGNSSNVIKCPGSLYYEAGGLCVQKADATYNIYSPSNAPCYNYSCRNFTPSPGNWNPPPGCTNYCNGVANYWDSYKQSCSSIGWRLPTYNELLKLTRDSNLRMGGGTYWSGTYEDESSFSGPNPPGLSPRLMVVEGGETPMPMEPHRGDPKARCVKTFNPNTDVGLEK